MTRRFDIERLEVALNGTSSVNIVSSGIVEYEIQSLELLSITLEKLEVDGTSIVGDEEVVSFICMLIWDSIKQQVNENYL